MTTQKVFDAFLVLQHQSGDKKALSLLVERHHLKLCRHVCWFLHDMDASKDVVQDCWGTIIKKLDGLNDPNAFGSWAMSIVTRKSLNELNKRTREREKLKAIVTVEIDEDAVNEKNADIEKMKHAINGLTKDQQIVLRLFYTQEYSLKEIGYILNISVGTVKSRLFHARKS
ncbi:RNA polymerase sigma factor [Maribacter halichondriae]|uniref:RNA polymerase sigma factor n=1 Tax=Maribacter halichondriae TaxID=2980554 RepID=UPI0023588305|nr:RNA polymerase sigma factor [Maribacter sp. Hal144]